MLIRSLSSMQHKQLPVAGWTGSRSTFSNPANPAIEYDTGGFGK